MNNTEKDLIKAVINHRDFVNRYDVMIANCYNSKYSDNEADVFAIRKSGLSDEFEIKVSRSDLLADKKKKIITRPMQVSEWGDPRYENSNGLKPNEIWKHEALLTGFLPVNYFWYVLKDGIGGLDDIPKFAGLIIVSDDGWLRVIRSPEKLKSEKLTAEEKYFFAKKIYYRYMKIINEA